MESSPSSTRTNGGSRAFGSFVLDLDRRELRRDGVKVRLTAKPLDTLTFLIENRGQVVTRDQLRAAIWDGLSVSDPAVEHAVNKVRRALGDDPANPTFIQTLWGKGYIFVADIAEPVSLPASPNDLAAANGILSMAGPAGNPGPVESPTTKLTVVETAYASTRFPEYSVQIGFAVLLYSGLYAISLLVETAYAFERYRNSLGWGASAIFLWIFSTTLAAVWIDWNLTRKGNFHGLTVAILIMCAAAGALFLGLGSFLPGSAITLFSFQGFTAHAAYFKSESYFLILAIALLALPFHFVVRVQHEVRAGRVENARSLLSRRNTSSSTPVIIYPRPSVMLVLLIGAGLWSLFSVAHIFEHLLPSPYMGRYMNLLQVQRLMYFALGFECLAWYYICLGRLDRTIDAAQTSLTGRPFPLSSVTL